MMPTPEGTKTPKAIAVTLCCPWFYFSGKNLQPDAQANRYTQWGAVPVGVQTPQGANTTEIPSQGGGALAVGLTWP